eukprot:6325032-Pyramimonas_sp.AAC.1
MQKVQAMGGTLSCKEAAMDVLMHEVISHVENVFPNELDAMLTKIGYFRQDGHHSTLIKSDPIKYIIELGLDVDVVWIQRVALSMYGL